MAEPVDIKVYNSIGAIVLTKKIQNFESNIDVSKLQNGIYYVTTNLGQSTKLVKVD